MKMILCVLACSILLLNAEVKSIKKSIPVKNGQSIELAGFTASTLRIKTWDKNEIGIDIRVDYSSSNKEYEKEYVQQVDIVQDESGDKTVITYKEPRSRNEGFSLKKLLSFQFSFYSNLNLTGEIYVPASSNLTADLRYGDYTVDGVKGILELLGESNTFRISNCSSIKKIENNYGKTIIDRCGGSMNLEAVSSTISLQNFNGTVDADVNYSTITLNDIKGSVKVTCISGEIEMDGIGGDVSLDANYSKVRVEKVKGKTTVTSQSGTVRIKGVQGADIDAPYSNITVESIIGSGESIAVKNMSGEINIYNCTRELRIEDSYSKIDLEAIQGNITIIGKTTSVYGKKINGNVSIRNEYGKISLDELNASTVEIVNKSDNVDIEFVNKPNKINIANEYGSVTVLVPDFSGDVKLKASYGNIKTNLPIEIDEMAGGQIAMGKIGNGNASVNIKVTSGDIDIHQRK